MMVLPEIMPLESRTAMSPSRLTGRRTFAVVLCVAVLLVAGATFAQTPFWQQPQQGQPAQPQPPATRAPATTATPAPARRQTATATTPAPAAASPVIARIEGRPLTQADFDRVAIPYFGRMRAQFGSGFEGDIVKIAKHNVLDELLRRELLRTEARRMKITPTPGDVDTVLARDPYFYTNGQFDRAKFSLYKTSPQSNYMTMLPELTELAAMDVLDRRLRQQMIPTSAAVREEWAKRNDQVKFHSFAILQRDVTLDPESTPQDWDAYYHAHPDAFTRRTRVRLRYVRIPLPAVGDSTRAAAEPLALAQAKAVLDSIDHKTLPDSSARLLDTGLFEPLSGNIPGIGFAPELQGELGRADSVASVRKIGPVSTRDAVIAGVITGREPKHLPPLAEVLGDVRRQADIEKRRTAAEDERRAFFAAHPERFVTRRMTVSRITLADDAFQTRPPTTVEIERWYAENWRHFLMINDTLKKSPPPLVDSLRAMVKPRAMKELRPKQIDQLMAKLATALKSSKDWRGAARAAGAAAETLTFVQNSTNDSLFTNPMVEQYYRSSARDLGVIQGPSAFSGRYVVWRVDSADSTFTPPFDLVRNRVDAAYREQERQKDETEARVFFTPRRTSYKAPIKYAVDGVRVRIAPADSVKIADAELQANYTAHKDRYRQEEEVHARHLLIMTQGLSPAQMADAKVRADSLLKAVRGGAEFVDLCRRFSQEPGASQGGGDLGFFGRGRMVKEFETAVFALKPGEVSDVVQTQFGYHIIRLEERKPAGLRSFDDVRAELRTEMAQARADSNAVRAARALRRKLAAGGDAAALAKPYGGIVSTTPFGVSEAVPDFGFLQGLSAELPRLVAGRWSGTVYRAADQYVLIRLREKTPVKTAEFDEVKTQAIEDMKAERKKQKLAEKIAAVRAALAAGTPPDTVAAPMGGLKEANPVTANAAFVPTLGFGPHIMPKILKLKRGEMSDTLTTPQGVMWVRMDERVPADASKFKTEKDQVQQEMIVNRMNDWLEEKKRTVRIDVLRADLREPKPGPYKTVQIGG